MGKNIHREVINGRMTVTQVRRVKGKPYTVYIEQSSFSGKELPPKEITKHQPGRTFVEILVYAGAEEKGEPADEWEFPHTWRYDLSGAARQAEAQTER